MNTKEIQSDTKFIEKIKKAQKFNKIMNRFIAPAFLVLGFLMFFTFFIHFSTVLEIIKEENFSIAYAIGFLWGLLIGLYLVVACNFILIFCVSKASNKKEMMLVKYYELYNKGIHNKENSGD
jgi:formate hydrogenlyase subunit 3/multisubunit Na+/H+ antiporter MnhD subunit